jgi:hypothetical protein
MPLRPDVFRHFREAPLLFAPSYKYDPGTLVYDTSSKARAPAWCDRVLFACTSSGLHLQCAEYGRCDVLFRFASCSLPVPAAVHLTLPTSDHMPVYAAFTSRVARIDIESRSQVVRLWRRVCACVTSAGYAGYEAAAAGD